MSTANTLSAAADLLERDGWCQRFWCDDDGRRGASAAIARVATGSDELAGIEIGDAALDELNAAHDALTDYLLDLECEPHISVTDWNDSPGATAAETIATIRAAAAESADEETL